MGLQKLLVSVRGKNEAREAVAGGAHIIDAEYPRSALGTQYPLNILAIRTATPSDTLVSTNIGEKQYRWSTAAQAALGVALAGADIIKVGLGGLKTKEKAKTVMKRVVRNVKNWFPGKSLIATLFADAIFAESVDPLLAPKIADESNAQGALIDTFDKRRGKSLLDYIDLKKLTEFVKKCHSLGLEAWVAGSLKRDHLPPLWKIGVDVICVRGVVCVGGREAGRVNRDLVRQLVETIPKQFLMLDTKC